MQGQGAKFYRSEDGVTYTQVAGLVDIPNEPEFTRGSAETSLMDQDGPFMTFDPNVLIDAGSLGIVLAWAVGDTAQDALYADLLDPVNKYYRCEYPSGDTFDFPGHITNWGKNTSKTERITRTVTFKISDEPLEVAAV